ncbi:MAG: phosphatase PAP2 family protein [Chlamydiia bacterium]
MADVSWRRALWWQCAALVLAVTWLWGPTQSLWDRMDWGVYHLFQGLASESRWFAYAMAVLNAPIGNWVMCGFLGVGVCPWLIKSRSWEEFARKAAEGSLYVILFFVAFFVISRGLFGSWLDFQRLSPSLVERPLVDLALLVPGLKVKCSSVQSFPSDHATQLLLLAMFGWRFGTRWRWVMAAIAVFFCCPRLVSGGHWFSDCFVGGLGIAMMVYGLGFVSPIHEVLLMPIEWVWRRLVGLPARPAEETQPS